MADTEETQVVEEKTEKNTAENQETDESDDWQAEKYRTKVSERIQDEITKTESQVPKSGVELEEFAFSKAKSRKQYFDLVARVLIYVAEFNKKRSKEAQESGEEKGDAEGKEKGTEDESKKTEEGETKDS